MLLLGLTITIRPSLIRLVIIVGARPFIAVLVPLLRLLRPLLLRLSLRLTLCRSLLGLSGLRLALLLLVLLRWPLLVLLLWLARQLRLRLLLRLVWLRSLWLLRLLLPLVLRLRRPLLLPLGFRPPGFLLLLRWPGPVRLFLLLTGAVRLPVGRRAFNSGCFTGVSSIYGLLIKDLIYEILFLEELCPLNFELLRYFPQFGNKHFAQFKNIMHVLKMCRKVSTIDFFGEVGNEIDPAD